ncbi:hypothetical protein [Chitinivibrio alkaliphilus]|uniref:Uncharacterized protein n=1 Tax=Chitinivibrio alkaliphilus ACht1 TaxID=1313304 RepID=U7D8E6_9BACT|nr:hypothetical protein [Chitinivibrio alkaliphilus]ERP38669.1 hypothetical protein CALK_0685 [Chitinivibrio alkaliphilus ACht1]
MRLFFLAFLNISVSVGAVETGQNLFQHAYAEWDSDAFAEAYDAFSQNTDSGRYWRAVTGFHWINYYLYGYDHHRDTRRGLALIDSVQADLAAIRKPRRFSGEVEALEATILGVYVTLHPTRAPFLGRRIQNGLDEAFAADSTNPRTLYLLGVSYYHMPGFLGGGFSAGREYLLRSDSLFMEEEQTGRAAPQWGHSTGRAFLGEIYRAEGNVAQAMAWYDRAKDINPQDGLARLGRKKAQDGYEQ